MNKILAVDDSHSMRQVLSFLLTRAGYEVEQAADGREALTMAEREHFELVLTDVQMPGIDGLELVRRLRSMPDYRTTPILTVTTLDGPEERDRGRAAGATGWIVKPFGEKKLLSTIQRVMA